MRRTVALAVLAPTVLVAVGVGHAGATVPPVTVVPGRLVVAETTPCQAEDSLNCYWDASVRGNGHGHSFTVIRQWMDEDHARGSSRVCVFFWNRRFARAHDNCSR